MIKHQLLICYSTSVKKYTYDFEPECLWEGLEKEFLRYLLDHLNKLICQVDSFDINYLNAKEMIMTLMSLITSLPGSN